MVAGYNSHDVFGSECMVSFRDATAGSLSPKTPDKFLYTFQ
jgi:hypothetical protein